MKNITYGYANEGRGLSTLVQFMWKKHLRHINYAVAHGQFLRPNVEADDRKFKAMKESFDMICTWLSVINTKYRYA